MRNRDLLQIQDKGAVTMVLSGLLQNPSLLLDSNYSLMVDDFPEKFHQVVFSAINNLFHDGIMQMDVPTLCNFLINSPHAYSIFEKNDGATWIETVRELCNLDNFETNYRMLKKFTLLRDIAKSGHDITDIYNFNEVDPTIIEKMQKKIFDMTTDEIINHYMAKMSDIAQKHSLGNIGVLKAKASDRVRDVIDKFKESPDVGMRLYNEWYNTCFRGAREGKFYLESAGSGSGKSRRQIREATFLSVPYLYDIDSKKWIHTGITPQKSCYICTELEEEEILPISVAFLSGVDEEKIKLNSLNQDEQNRINQAIDLLEQFDNFSYVCISDYDISDLEKIIIDKVMRDNCKFFFFDYIHSTVKSLSYYGRTTGVKLQEHQVLFLTAVSLKSLCQKYKIFIYSATQINAQGMAGEVRDEQSLRGSKQIADKVDAGVILSRITKQDQDKIKDIVNSSFCSMPTHCTAIYKNRGGRMRGIYLWSIMSLDNMREKFLFATNTNYEPIEFKFLEIVTSDEDLTPKDEELLFSKESFEERQEKVSELEFDF